jgi:glucan biosynthesis protein C
MSSQTLSSKPIQDQPNRYYAFDHIKTTMMIGVVVAHSAVTYMVINPGKVWPAKDPHTTSIFLDVLVGYLACITMPVFFVVSGFLTGMLAEKYGVKQMMKNRLSRILYPLLTSILTVVPITAGAFYYFNFTISNVKSPFLSAITQLYHDGFGLSHFQFMHLWFLYCLVLFCLVGGIIVTFVKKNAPSTASITGRTFSFIYNLKAAPLLFSIPTFILLCLRSRSIIETPVTFLTDFTVLASHAVFFFFGWLLFYEKNIFRFKNGDLFFCILGFCFFAAKIIVYVRWGEAGITGYVLAAINALFVWFLVFAHIGLYLRYFDKYSRIGRYLSDASYWIYLVHLPIVLVLQASLIHSSLGAYSKFFLVVIITFAITITSYNYLVRDTFIGSFLNGRRYKRGLPN